MVGLLLPVDAGATDGAANETTESAAAEPLAGTPRFAVQTYLGLARAERFAEAGALLELGRAKEERRQTLARRLSAVLERHLQLDLDKISDAESGTLNDGLPASLEQLGTIPSVDGQPGAVRLHRRAGGAGWAFSSATVSHVDGWYEQLQGRWLLDHLPTFLLRPGPNNILWWQWLGLLLLTLTSLGLGVVSASVVRRLLSRVATRTSTTWDDQLIARSAGPLRLTLALGCARILVPWLFLSPSSELLVHRWLRGLFLAGLLWMFWRLVDVSAELAWESNWINERAGSRALIPLARRAGKAVVGIAAVVLFLSALGYPVTSLIAGLGIGGLALALASQKTVENLFGAFSLGIDQPFREGDFVRVDDLVGTVEALGLRSTRFRTLDRTLISIPNGKLAEMRLETFAARDRLRLACTVGLVYETTEAQMRAVLAGLEEVLRSHPKIWPDNVTVRFKQLANFSLDIEIMAWFSTTDWNEFLVIRQDVLLAFMRVVESAGTSFAFPTQTVHVPREAAPG